MNSDSHVDLIDELRFRRWARQYYVSPQYREPGWHPIILDEMSRKDSELITRGLATATDAPWHLPPASVLATVAARQ